MKKDINDNSEIHRLKEFTHYDKDQFEKLYRVCKPIIKNLARNVDNKRFGVSNDIIQSYFWDKFMFVYNKYQDDYDYERLKATLIASLQVYKNKLLRNAYTKKAEFNQELTSFEVLFDDSKEWVDDVEEVAIKESLSRRFQKYMEEHLTPDEYLLFVTELNPPPYFSGERRVSILNLIKFFGLPKNKRSQSMISQMRNNIKAAIDLAKIEFKKEEY